MQFTIRQKMGGTLGITCVGMAIIVVFMLVGFSKVQRQQNLMDRLTLVNNTALRGNIAMLKAREYEAEFFDRRQEKWVPRAKEMVGKVNGELDVIAKNSDDPKIRGAADKARALAGKYVAQLDALAGKARASDYRDPSLAEDREELRDVINEFEPLLDSTIPKQVTAAYQAANREMDDVIATTRTQIVVTVGAVAAILIACLLTISLSISASLRTVIGRLQDIADGDGDLTTRIELTRHDEFGELASCFNNFVEKLHAIIYQVSQSTLQVASASFQLQATAEQMARGAEAAVTQANTVSTASEELAASTYQIAGNCGTVAESARLADESARTGVAVVDETIAVMGRIADRVKDSARTVESLGVRGDQIGAIISTIEDIADQTNLLALNAAIEAARAGEQGRGFAVVADEVRALAERTSRATREISQMIKSIQVETREAVTVMEQGVKEVARGTGEAARSGEALRQILEQFATLNGQVGQISTAADEQTRTTAEISTSIVEISDIILATAKGATDSAGAAGGLAHLAEELKSLVGRFRLAA
ncbi:methyl-accepting chemotaxis protein [Geobacter pickeringii]|uniref:Chemotaxis protein n=1 Tax=Geobacter pickeringii TaxID=345632 RepID=A0A0B5BCF1_9BACT|nr:methyl-accepting chemotaxis protein [Geobacter pickeringii]AJE04363.1 chemotaxis protein [Geobacter pickeringii]